MRRIALRYRVYALSPAERIAYFFCEKYRKQANTRGYYRAALNLKKQGVPLDVAKIILGVK